MKEDERTLISLNTGTIFLVFLILKLCNVITWPWIWVFAPLWIPFAIFIIWLILYFIVIIIDSFK